MLTGAQRQGGIRRRIAGVFVPFCILFLGISAAAFILASIFQMRIADAGTGNTATRAARYSEELLLEQGIQAAGHYADAKAESIRSQVQVWFAALDSLRDSATALYAQQDQLPTKMLPTVQEAAALGNTLSVHYGLSPGVSLDAELRRELSFYANLAPVWMAAVKHMEQISSLYITTPSGINIGCDSNALQKIAFSTYEIRNKEWYTKARDSGSIYISDAYQDSFGRGLTITLVVPIYAEDIFLGALGMDILIESINQDILQTQIIGNGFAMLTSSDGVIISPSEYAKQNIGDLLEQQNGNPLQFAEDDAYVIEREINAAGWSLFLVLPVEGIVEPARQAVKGIEQIAQDTRQRMVTQLAASVAGALLLFTVLILIAVRLAHKVADRLSEPIIRLCRDVGKIGEESFHYTCTIRTGDEIEQLGQAFQSMTHRLARHILQLAEITAERERISTELNVATRIQTGMLPCIFPPFPNRKEFDLYAVMQPAREVGGDFYDFFLVEENRLVMVIGDVSGKGVPAALFMVIAKTLIKNYCQMGLDPAQVLEQVNGQLCQNNDAGLFVTAFLCMLEISNGQLTWANAGHNLPLIRQHGEWRYLDAKPGFVLAGMAETAYRQESIQLHRGDMLLLYTDGVTESENPQGELFSDKRLLGILERIAPDCGVQEIVKGVVDAAIRFGGDAQADDITLLEMQYRYNMTKGAKEYV